ncbi:zinc finger protein JAGGED-like isoform X2 [Prosopis cineraria]|uniref:zinc finger protein JAGGED-like isoform X2 n=1 Tax=Prosopis cineraria TaxID=364024 RepID=UPI00241075B1|nr:zinc finger protein JAGGED-like isoform X2 [Prosopis cineraria]
MRTEENPLDLNNLPDDYSRDGKQVLEDTSSERETETLNHARQLVFRNDHSIAAQLGCCQPVVAGSYNNNNVGDPTTSLRFPRYLSASSSSSSPSHAPHQSYLYASSSQPVSSFPSHHHHHHPVISDYYVGHALHNHNYVASSTGGGGESGYTSIGAPVGHVFGGGDDGSLHIHEEDGLNPGRHSYSAVYQHRADPPSAINRFQDGF